MATWTGWQNEFLNRAGIIVTPPNRQLLTSWAANATSNCQNNPIDMTTQLAGSTRCAFNTGIHGPTQKYTSHAQAATAFRDEIHESFARNLLRAMNTGNPYQVSYTNDVASVFGSWGSDKMVSVFLQGEPGTGGGGGGGSAAGVSAHKGWTHLRRAVNHSLPKSLSASQRNVDAALRSLGHTHKVKV